MAPSKDTFRRFGDIMNLSCILTNIIMTSAVMLGVPKGAYDQWWLRNGFCVDQRDDRWIDTEILCFSVLVGSAIVTWFFRVRCSTSQNKQLRAKIDASMFSNFSHGAGHLVLLLLGGPPPPLEFVPTITATSYLVMLVLFWVGALRVMAISLSTPQAVGATILILAVQGLLDVPPSLAFTYSQSVILFVGAIDQISLAPADKGFTYAVVASSYLPLFIFYWLEMTTCSQFLFRVGGHAVYDTYLALLPFLLYYAVQRYEGKASKSKTT